MNTIGGNHYFLRQRVKEEGMVLNSGQNIIETGELEDAYKRVEKELGISVLRLNYIPEEMVFNKVSILNNRAKFEFNYDNRIIYFVQEREGKEISRGLQSDRKKTDRVIKNKWLNMDTIIEENILNNRDIEYSVIIYFENVSYRLFGILPERELISIVENLNFK